MLPFVRMVAFLLLILLLGACTTPAIPEASRATQASNTHAVSSAEPWPQPGRYAVQWKGYIGGMAGEPVYLSFAFIDVFAQAKQHRQPQFNEITLLSDHGALPAIIESVSSNTAQTYSQLFTVLMKIDSPPPGTHRFQELQYVDEIGRLRRLAVGDWIIEVLAAPTSELREDETTVGATMFTRLEAELVNTLPVSVTVKELRFAIPSLTVTTTLTAAEAHHETSLSPAVDSSKPMASAQSSTEKPRIRIPSAPVNSVVLEPGQSKRLTFTFHPDTLSQQSPFVALTPFLVYQTTAGIEPKYHLLPGQIYSRSFTNEEDIKQYLHSLPPTAYHFY